MTIVPRAAFNTVIGRGAGRRRRLAWLGAAFALALLLARGPAVVSATYLNLGMVTLLKTVLAHGPGVSASHPPDSGELASSQSALASAEQWQPRSAPVAAAHGRLALLDGDPGSAATYFSRALALGDGSTLIHFQLGWSLDLLGIPGGALAEWQQARAAGYFVQHGLLLRHQRDWQGAESMFRRAATIAPTDAAVWHALGIFYWEWDKRALALDCLRRALTYESEPYALQLLTGEVALLDGRPADAELVLQAAVRRQPDRPEAYARLADAAEQRGDAQTALQRLQQGIENVPQDLGLALRLAGRLSAQADFAAADQVYAGAHGLDPHSDEPLLLRAQNALAWGHSADAELFLVQAVRLNPGNADSQFWLGNVLAARASWPAACDAYRRAAALAPGDPAYQPPAEKLDKCRNTP